MGREKFNAVILKRIVRSADHHASRSAQRTRQVGNGRCWHWPQQAHIHTRSRKPRLQSRLEHVSGNTCIFSNQYPTASFLPQHHARGPAKFQHELRCHRPLPHRTSYAIGPKYLHIHSPYTATAARILTDITPAATNSTQPKKSPKQKNRLIKRRFIWAAPPRRGGDQHSYSV
ncbi:hypothetical protein GALL_503240 [mine drainage metagenome]|uniref:Uncharacterized protein n=1 Tax=mine drainage metagenome TaxID=410659 RepID=A0A1J5PA54_9ZZZZ